jgi:hypothetical protein
VSAAPTRLTGQRYGRRSERTLGNAAWKILTGGVDSDWLAEAMERCASRSNLVPGEGHLVRSCWHRAAAVLLEQGLRPLP